MSSRYLKNLLVSLVYIPLSSSTIVLLNIQNILIIRLMNYLFQIRLLKYQLLKVDNLVLNICKLFAALVTI